MWLALLGIPIAFEEADWLAVKLILVRCEQFAEAKPMPIPDEEPSADFVDRVTSGAWTCARSSS